MEERKICFKAEKNNRISEFLKENLSKRFYRHLKSISAKYTIQGVEKKLYQEISAGEELEIVYFEPEKYYGWQQVCIKPRIEFENEHYLIVYKPAGLLTIPIQANPNSIYQQLVYYLGKNDVHILNRLDKKTSGLMVVAKDGYARSLLEPTHQHIIRKYICLVEGKVIGEGTISKPIKKCEDSNKRMISENGKMAISHYKTIRSNENRSLLEFVLATGRTHQIRLHTASMGHPIIGDELYGSYKEEDLLHLLSYYVSFIDPFTKKQVEVSIKEDWVDE